MKIDARIPKCFKTPNEAYLLIPFATYLLKVLIHKNCKDIFETQYLFSFFFQKMNDMVAFAPEGAAIEVRT